MAQARSVGTPNHSRSDHSPSNKPTLRDFFNGVLIKVFNMKSILTAVRGFLASQSGESNGQSASAEPARGLSSPLDEAD
jgi:hypothetical protein